MHRGFNLKLTPNEDDVNAYQSIGLSLYEADRNLIEKTIKSFKNPDNTINGSKLQASWFPIIKAHAFISHSHKDKDTIALTLAGWLYENFGIKSFIDSCIWGYADDLLKLIDNTYCWTDANRKTYNYTKRNHSTSHVHMMLSTALSTMMDETECLIFLNTPNSITPNRDIDKTLSPWIYSEIAMSRLIRKKSISDYRETLGEIKTFSKGGILENYTPKLNVEYDVDLSHLTNINMKSLNDWVEYKSFSNAHDALDTLYELNP